MDKGKGKLIEDDDRNNLPGSHNFFGGGGDRTVVLEQQRVAPPSPTPLPHTASKKKRTEWRPLSDFTDQITPRLRWTLELHNQFVRATKQLGGPNTAKPKTLIEAMAIKGLTQQHVKSRLQALRRERITDIWGPPRKPGCKSKKAGKIDDRKSASNTAGESASTSSQEHGRNGPGMGDQNVGGNLETGTVTAQQQPHHDFNQNMSPEQIQNHLELDERSRTVSAGHQQPSQVDVAGISAANGYSIPGQYNNSAHWVHPAQASGVGLQGQTSNGYSIPGPDNNSTSSTAINNVLVGLQQQTPGFLNEVHWFHPARYGVDLQMQTLGFNGFYYNLHQPGNEAHWFHPARYGFGLHMQTPGIQNHNGFYYNLHQPGNEVHWFHPARYGFGLHMQTPGIQNQNGAQSIQSAEDGVVIQKQPSGLYHPVYNATHMIQQHSQDGGALGNIQQQNQYFCLEPQAETDTVQAQNATAVNFQVGNVTHMIQQPAQDVRALGNIQQQNQYFSLDAQAATDTVQAQNATAANFQVGNVTRMIQQPAQDGGALGNMMTTEDQQADYFLNLDSPEPDIADYEILRELWESCGFAGQPL